jgi:hypothetical protein
MKKASLKSMVTLCAVSLAVIGCSGGGGGGGSGGSSTTETPTNSNNTNTSSTTGETTSNAANEGDSTDSTTSAATRAYDAKSFYSGEPLVILPSTSQSSSLTKSGFFDDLFTPNSFNRAGSLSQNKIEKVDLGLQCQPSEILENSYSCSISYKDSSENVQSTVFDLSSGSTKVIEQGLYSITFTAPTSSSEGAVDVEYKNKPLLKSLTKILNTSSDVEVSNPLIRELKKSDEKLIVLKAESNPNYLYINKKNRIMYACTPTGDLADTPPWPVIESTQNSITGLANTNIKELVSKVKGETYIIISFNENIWTYTPKFIKYDPHNLNNIIKQEMTPVSLTKLEITDEINKNNCINKIKDTYKSDLKTYLDDYREFEKNKKSNEVANWLEMIKPLLDVNSDLIKNVLPQLTYAQFNDNTTCKIDGKTCKEILSEFGKYVQIVKTVQHNKNDNQTITKLLKKLEDLSSNVEAIVNSEDEQKFKDAFTALGLQLYAMGKSQNGEEPLSIELVTKELKQIDEIK